MQPVPTVKDLRARRLEQLTAALRERLAAGDFDDMRAVVTALADEFDVMDIAAAAVKMAHGATGGDDGGEEIAAAPAAPAARGGRAARARRPATARSGVARVFFGAGKKAGIRPGDLVGAIAGESGVPSSAIGGIRIAENFSVVEVPEDLADAIIARGRRRNAARQEGEGQAGSRRLNLPRRSLVSASDESRGHDALLASGSRGSP